MVALEEGVRVEISEIGQEPFGISSTLRGQFSVGGDFRH